MKPPSNSQNEAAPGSSAAREDRRERPPTGAAPRTGSSLALCLGISRAGSLASPLLNILPVLQSTACLRDNEEASVKGKGTLFLTMISSQAGKRVSFPSPLRRPPAPRVVGVCPITCCNHLLSRSIEKEPASLLHPTSPSAVYSLKHSVPVFLPQGTVCRSPGPAAGEPGVSRGGGYELPRSRGRGNWRSVLAGSRESRAPSASAFPWELSIPELTINCRKAGNFLRNVNYFLYPADRWAD